MTDRIARSVAFTLEVDQALDALATAEGTSRADLVRQALTMLFSDRGIDLDAQAGIATDRVAVTNQRNRRRASIGDQDRAALAAWWIEHRADLASRSRDPDRLASVVEHLIANVERDGTTWSNLADRVAGPDADALEVYVDDDAVRELIAVGAIKYERKRGQPARIRVAPWVI